MTASAGTIPPPVSWAQRSELVYIVIDVECKDIEHKVTESTFYFKGTNALDDKKYEVTLNFYKPVDPERVSSKNIARCLEFTIYKKEAGPYWPTLIAEKSKLHFLKANFSKWRNESDDEMDDMDMMGGMDGIGNNFPLMGNQDWNNKCDQFNLDDEDDDSDDEIPSLTQNDDDEEDAANAEKKADAKTDK